MNAPPEWLEDLRSRAAQGKIMLVCGTGVSAALSGGAENATWISLLQSGVSYLSRVNTGLSSEALAFQAVLNVEPPSTPGLIAVAQWIRGQFQEKDLPGGVFANWLESTVGSLSLARDSDTSWSFLKRTGIPVLTTNYDDLLKDVTERAVLTWQDQAKMSRYFDNLGKYVFHLHGHWDAPSSVVLSGGDYQRLADAPVISRVFEQLVASYTPVLIGYGNGMSDPNFSDFLSWYTENFGVTGHRLYVLCRDQEAPTSLVTPQNQYFLSYGAEFDDLPRFLSEMLEVSRKGDNPAAPHDRAVENSAGPAAGDGILSRLPGAVSREVEDQLGKQSTWGSFQSSLLKAEDEVTAKRGVALISAVTGTGKTTVSRAAMNLAIAGGHSAVMLVPTKALVAQEVREWEAWVSAWQEAGREIGVYPASRDYPESDAPVSRGRFEVAIAIYEKIASYLACGQPTLNKTALLVVDELQTLVGEQERATKLEGLLTMVRLLPRDSRPAIVGLSATLSRESTELLRRWLDVQPDAFIQSVERSVPLDTYVVGATRVRKQPDAHLFGLGDPSVTPPPFEEMPHDLLGGALTSQQGSARGLSTAALAVTLVTKLLSEDSARRILVFVPGRTAAEELAISIQRSLDGRLGAPNRKRSPWLSGRFAKSGVDSSIAEDLFLQLKHSDIPMAEDVIRGLRLGVAYHSARLPAQLRRLLEEEFRNPDGLLRVLVATDTLAQGVNLPADTVINCSLAGYGKDGLLELARPAELDNKAGRAGRRGLAARARGEFYILVPSEDDLQQVKNVTSKSVKLLASIPGVFEEFVIGTDRTPKVIGRIRALDDVALLTLHVLCSDGFGRRMEALEGRVELVRESLLAAQTPDIDLPSAQMVIERLRALKLITGQPGGKYWLSELGEALGRSALSLTSAYVLEQLARIAVQGAGDIDILYNACRSVEIDGVTAWIGLPSVPSRHYPSLKENILTYALAYSSDSPERRRDCAQFFAATSRYPLPKDLVEEGQRVVSTELLAMLERDVELIDNKDATALLRALVAYEWSRGVPFNEMKARFSSAIVSDVKQSPGRPPVEIKIHYADVEQLCEQVAGVVRGSTAISFSESHDWSTRMASLALRVEVGLPFWLAPIAKLRNPLLHRSRLSKLWKHNPPENHLSEVLDLPEIAGIAGVTPEQLQSVKELIDLREMQDGLRRHQIAQLWSTQKVPGLAGTTFEEFGGELERASNVGDYIELLLELGEGLGMNQSRLSMPDHFCGLAWESGDSHIHLAVPEGEVGAEEIEAVADQDCIVVLRSRLRISANMYLSQHPIKARFIRPEVLLALVARLYEARGDGLLGSEVIERLKALRVSILDAEGVALSVDAPTGPPPFTGPPPEVSTRIETSIPLSEGNAS